MASNYDLVQKERVCGEDLWLCDTNPDEKCYKPCRIHNPQACDTDRDDGDIYANDEIDDVSELEDFFDNDEVWISDEDDTIEFEDDEVWQSDGDMELEEFGADSDMDRWVEFAGMLYTQVAAQEQDINELDRWQVYADLYYSQQMTDNSLDLHDQGVQTEDMF